MIEISNLSLATLILGVFILGFFTALYIQSQIK
jgi:hypothetical protein